MWNRKIVETNRGEFEVFIAGDGPPLCVTHLYSEFNERGYYFADRFVEHFKVHLINLKEAGNSPSVESEHELSMLETTKDLEAIREKLEYEEWTFAGHSTGGMLGLVYAIQFPGSLSKILVGGATATKEYMNHEGSMYSPNSPLNGRLLELFGILQSPDSVREERMKAGREWTEMSLYRPEYFEKYFSKPSSGKVVNKRLNYFSEKELPTFDLRGDLGDVTVSAFVYCGKHDAQCPIVFSEEIHKLLPNSTFYIFDESSHLPYLEEQETFDQMVVDFRNQIVQGKSSDEKTTEKEFESCRKSLRS